ncbi:DUF6843 domain-containing protein [Fervidibacillus halotolerans]|uniref:DUF6843 domain-containing protein n=1 Tax=Fervidibacillus halotolerans TaxID=2980027 RepID=A0A9E8RZ03_9BACI|nr:hypothetical protein [Fervidibacillus halotolerans]WAA13381.1 hypothetical protein OE105_04510 [Fervidibacillus halotolerans]
MNYYLPEGFQGCAYVFYNVESEPPLTLKDGVIDYHFNEDGILLTSSPPDFGWEGRDSSGFYQANYYSGDRLMDKEEITFSSLGEGYVYDVGKYYYEKIGVKEEYCTHISGVARRIFQNK